MSNLKDTLVTLPPFKANVQLIKAKSYTDWSHQFYSILDLHKSGRRGQGIKVAVLDTGIDLSHDSFKPAIDSGRLKAIDARLNQNDPTDRNGHGTWCCSRFISDGADVLGFSPKCQLTSYKVLGDGGSGSLADVLNGVQLAIEEGVQIISTSLGWNGSNIKEFEDIAKYVQSKGIVWVSAAGNDGKEEHIDYPALYNEIYSIGSHNSKGERSYFSDFGVDLDLYSSGEDVLGAYTRNREAYLQGTSMSTPSIGAIITALYNDIVDTYGTIDREILKKLATCL
jgi:major intracellular serine protease